MECVSKLFRAYGLYNQYQSSIMAMDSIVSKLFRAYGLYNEMPSPWCIIFRMFQSSFELTGYITQNLQCIMNHHTGFQSSFELTGYITTTNTNATVNFSVSKLFRAYGLYNICLFFALRFSICCFKALSSLRVI